MASKHRGLLIEIVGIPGSGKSTLADALSMRLAEVAPVCVDSPYLGKGATRRGYLRRELGTAEKMLTLSVHLHSKIFWRMRLAKVSIASVNADRKVLKALAMKKAKVSAAIRRGQCAFVIPDTSFSSLVSQCTVDAQLLSRADWSPDVLVILEIDPADAHFRIHARNRPGDKYLLMDHSKFNSFARQCRMGHNFLADQQLKEHRTVIRAAEETLEGIAQICLGVHFQKRRLFD